MDLGYRSVISNDQCAPPPIILLLLLQNPGAVWSSAPAAPQGCLIGSAATSSSPELSIRLLKMQFHSWKQFNLHSSVTGYQIHFPLPQLQWWNYMALFCLVKVKPVRKTEMLTSTNPAGSDSCTGTSNMQPHVWLRLGALLICPSRQQPVNRTCQHHSTDSGRVQHWTVSCTWFTSMRYHLLVTKVVKVYRYAVNFLWFSDLVFASSNVLFLTLHTSLAQAAHRPNASLHSDVIPLTGAQLPCETERFLRWPLTKRAVALEKGLPTGWHSLQLCCYYTKTHVM